MQQIQRQLQTNRFHIRFLQGTRNIHVHLQEPFHRPAEFGLFNLQLRQQINEPLERALIAIDPEEVHLKETTLSSHISTLAPVIFYLSQIHYRRWDLAGPRIFTFRTCVPCLPISMHYRLQYRGERSHSDAGRNENGMLGAEDVTGRRPVGSIQVDLKEFSYATLAQDISRTHGS